MGWLRLIQTGDKNIKRLTFTLNGKSTEHNSKLIVNIVLLANKLKYVQTKTKRKSVHLK